MGEKEVVGKFFIFYDQHEFEVIKKKEVKLNETFVYLQPTSLEGHNLPDWDRKLYRIVNVYKDSKSDDNFIVRRLRAKSLKGFKIKLNDDKISMPPITMSNSNAYALNAKNGHTIRIDNIKPIDRFNYYWKHPETSTQKGFRLGIIGILLTIIFGFISIIF